MWPVLILFIAGIALILTEFFVPGGVLGVLGGVLVLASIALGWYHFPEYGVLILVGELAGVVVAVGAGLYLLFKTPLGGAFIHKENETVEAGYRSFAHDSGELRGQVATVHNTLRPAGSILFDGRRIDAVSNGTFIEQGKRVRIVEVEGHRVVCEALETGDAGEETGA